MPVNMGTIDQYVRIVVGLALVAYALQDGLSIQGWHWAGLIGLVLLGDGLLQELPAISGDGYRDMRGSLITEIYIEFREPLEKPSQARLQSSGALRSRRRPYCRLFNRFEVASIHRSPCLSIRSQSRRMNSS